MLIFYTLQGADGEDPKHPNAFQIPGNKALTKSDIVNNFPVNGRRKSHYHIRFKKVEGKTSGSYVWEDLKAGENIPSYNGTIWLKILRLKGAPPPSRTPTKARSGSGPTKVKQRRRPPARPPTNAAKAPKPKTTARRSPVATPAQRKATVATPKSPGWDKIFADSPAETAPTVSLDNIEDIRDKLPLDFNEKSKRVQRALVKRVRDQQVATDSARDERRELDKKAAKRQAAKDDVEKTVKDKVMKWHKDSTGQVKGLWTLLCNLNQALWQPNPWIEVDSSQMLERKYVKRMYRKAIKIVHPDRLPPDATPAQEVTSQLMFQYLQEAWKTYSQKM